MNLKFILLLSILFLTCFNIKAQEVYVLNSHSQLEPTVRAVTLGNKIRGAAILAAYGAKVKTNLVIDGGRSELVLPMGAVYFYIKSPKDMPIKSWKLAPLNPKKNQTRELTYQSTGAYSGSSTKISEIGLRFEQISDEIYKVYPITTLENGEYALFRMETGVPAELYDFRVDQSLSPALNLPKNEIVLSHFKVNNIQNQANSENESLLLGSRTLQSDVDIDIPTTKKTADNTFALIISNENYKQVEDVPFAHNDGKVFEQYLRMSVGVPENHITRLENASLSDIKFALNKIKDISEAYEGDAKIILHYSGHGIPDENNKEGYLLPVDGYASDPTTALKLSDLYSQLGSLNAKSLIVFLDACFSGAQKDGHMLASARGVAIKVKEDKPTGNLVVVSAAQGDQTAYPYTSKGHGLMTYFLLKKLQETNGDVKLGELTDYITTQVKRTSLVENGKYQVPVTLYDEDNDNWRNQTLR
ncbi:MAG: caspase family protein [Bacteroides sp.]|nr:caspase family protein [Bacteroides sp.]